MPTGYFIKGTQTVESSSAYDELTPEQLNAKYSGWGYTPITKDEYAGWQEAYSKLGIAQYGRPTSATAVDALKRGQDYVSQYLSKLGQQRTTAVAESDEAHAARMAANQQAATDNFYRVATPEDLAKSAAANSGLVSVAATPTTYTKGGQPFDPSKYTTLAPGTADFNNWLKENGITASGGAGTTGSTAATVGSGLASGASATGYKPLAPSMLLQGTTLKETDLARTTGTNIYKRDLAAEQAKIGEFVKMMGNPPTDKSGSDSYWRKFHDFVYEGKQPIQYQEQSSQGGSGIVPPQATGGSSQGLIADTVSSATGLTGATSKVQEARNALLTKMDELVSVIKNSLSDQQKAVGLVDKGNKITDLETQIANETAEWDKKIAGNRDNLTSINAIERDEAYMVRQKNLSLLPKIQLLAIQKEDYERAEQLAKDNAAQVKEAKLAELDRIKTELGFLTDDEEAEAKKVEDQINKEDQLMTQGYVKLSPSAWKDLKKKLGITPENESQFVLRSYNLKTGGIDIWKAPSAEAGSEWGDPYMLGGDYVQKNKKTGEIRTAVNVPKGDTSKDDPDEEKNLSETEYKREAAKALEEKIVSAAMKGVDGKISNENWNELKRLWIEEFLPAKDFDAYFRKYINEKYASLYKLEE